MLPEQWKFSALEWGYITYSCLAECYCESQVRKQGKYSTHSKHCDYQSLPTFSRPSGVIGGRALVVCEVCVLNSIHDIRRMGREKAWLTFVHHLLTAGLCLSFLAYILINSQSTLSEWELLYVFIPL